MSDQTRAVISQTAIYTVGTVVRNLASVIMLPIYTRFLMPSDYGVIELLTTTIDLFSIIFGMKIGEAIFRYHAEYRDRKDQHEVVSSALWLVIALTTIGLILIESFSGELATLAFGNAVYAREIELFGTILPLAAIVEIAFLYFRVEQKPWQFVTYGTIRLVLQLSLNIYFVVGKGLRVDGVVYSAVASNAIMAAILVTYTTKRVGFRFSATKAKALEMFSWPLIINAIGMYYATMADRYYLRVFGDLTQVGIYSLGYKFGVFLIMFAWSPFASVWASQRYIVLRAEDPTKEFNKIFIVASLILLTSALTIAVLASDALRIMSAREFWGAATIAPIIVVAYVLQAWMGFANVGIFLRHKTIHTAYSTIASCVVITAAYSLLIPRFGALGAAFGTLVGFVFRFAWIYVVSKRHYDMGLKWGRVVMMSGLAIAIFFLGYFAPKSIVYSVMFHGISILAFLFLVMWLPIFSTDERRRILSLLKNPRSAFVRNGSS